MYFNQKLCISIVTLYLNESSLMSENGLTKCEL